MPQLQHLKFAPFSQDAFSSSTEAIKVSNAKPVMVCNMHIFINNSS